MLAKLITLMPVGRDDEKGATAVEYGLMVALIGGVIIATVAALGGPVMGLYARVNWW